MSLNARYSNAGISHANAEPLSKEKMLLWLRYWSDYKVLKLAQGGVLAGSLTFSGWDASLDISRWWWLVSDINVLRRFIQFSGCAMLGGRLRSLSQEEWRSCSDGLPRPLWKWALLRIDQQSSEGLALPPVDELPPSADEVFTLGVHQLERFLKNTYPKTSTRLFAEPLLNLTTQRRPPAQLAKASDLSVFSEADWCGAAKLFFSDQAYSV